MNKVYSLKYSAVHGAVIAVSELCKRRSRSSTSGRVSKLLKTSAIGVGLLAGSAGTALALPTGGQVAAGKISIKQASPSTMKIVQSTQKGIINWQSFGVGANQSVDFVQPSASSVTLNRVMGSNPTAIYGHLNANGQVFLVNPNGVLFAPGASVNVGGIVASTLGISDQDFLAGNYHFSGAGSGSVVNQGAITAAKGGYVALIGPTVRNDGEIQAPQGSVDLGGGGAVDMTFADNTLVSFQVNGAALDAAVSNGGAIDAQGGHVVLSAEAKDALLKTVVNNTGVVSADSVADNGGTVTLLGGPSGSVQVSGRLSASSQDGTGGTVSVTGQEVTVGSGAQIDATGGSGGGEVNIGGSLRGGSLPLATTTRVDSGATLDASATTTGNGGAINVVSDLANPASLTVVHGNLLADGGSLGGDGGRIETSGATLDSSGIVVRAGAPKGNSGHWLLDPSMIEITSSPSASGTSSSNSSNTTTISATSTSYVDPATIDSALNSGTSVTVQTSGLGSNNDGAFDVWVLSPITKSAGGTATLTLQAANSVYVGAPISSSSGPLNVNLYAGNDGGTLTGHGAVLLAADITTDGGAINFGTNQSYTYSQSGVTQLAGGDVYVDSQLSPSGGAPSTSQLITLDTTSATGSGGDVNIYGQTLIANPAGLTINTAHTGSSGSDGNVYFAGTIDSGNTFQYVSTSETWNGALTAAQSGTGANVGDTYLATIPTSLINAVASFSTNYRQAWLGGERLVSSSVTGTPNSSDSTSLYKEWYWVTGPLGLVVNSSSPTGYGTAFFTQHGSTTQNGQGGTAYNGAYTNWNPSTSLGSGYTSGSTLGEPNNSSGTNMTPSGAREWVLQFVGTAGQWNDLPPSSMLGYVKETNLAAAPLTVNSGTGNITLGAGVGTNAPLESFNATGNLINLPQNPSIDTTNGANVNGQAQVWNGSAYVPTTLLSITAVNASQTYGSAMPGGLQISYTEQGQSASPTPPSNVSAASVSWNSTSPSSSSDVGIYQATVSGASWSGSGANPYTFLYVNGALTINPAHVSVTGLSAANRAYNGSTTVALTGAPELTGLMNGDTGSLNGGSPYTGTVASADVQLVNGTPQPQAVTTNFSYTLSSGNPADYTFVQPTLTATITPATIHVTGLTAQPRNYDGTTVIALTGTPNVSGFVGTTDAGNVSNLKGTVASPNVQWVNSVAQSQAVTGNLQLNVTSGNANDYTLAQPALGSVVITPAPVSVTGLSPVARNYDRTTTVALGGTPVFNGVVPGESLTIGNLANAGTASAASVGTHSVTAHIQLADAASGPGSVSNYVLSAQPTVGSVTISAKPLQLGNVTLSSPKVYDGTTSVQVLSSQLTGVAPGDQVGFVSSASVPPNTMGTAVPVTFHDYLTGTGAANYTLTQPTGMTIAVIPPAQNVVAPVQGGVSALAATTSTAASTGSTTGGTSGGTSGGSTDGAGAMPPVVVNGPVTSGLTSISVVNGGVNAPGVASQNNGFAQSLPSSVGGQTTNGQEQSDY